MKKMKKIIFMMVSIALIFTLASCDITKIDFNDIKNFVTGIFNNKEETPTNNKVSEGLIYDDLQIHFLELGNKYSGDSVYIKAGDNDILIDAGSKRNSSETIEKYVNKYCTDGKLEYVIATHAHEDHIAGFSGTKNNGIFYKYEVGTLIDFALTTSTSKVYEDYLIGREKLIEAGTKHYSAEDCFYNKNNATNKFDLGGGIELEILYNFYYTNVSNDENNHSVCSMINYNNHHFMFTGDLEKEGEEKMAEYYDGSSKEKTLPHVDLFKAGHHGSKTSSNECLLSKITPDICCVCCCAGTTEYTANYNNIFPTQEFINRISKYTDQVYVTSVYDENTLSFKSMNGNIIVSSNGEEVSVAATNNTTKLKDTDWFNEIVYIDKNNNITSGKGKEDFFTNSSNEVVPVKRRVWKSQN